MRPGRTAPTGDERAVTEPGRGHGDYPVVVSVTGRLCLVVGAGAVAARKARGLLECGARITVVAPELSSAMETLAEEVGPEQMRIERRPYRSGDVAGHELVVVVVATGNRDTDRRVSDDALAAGALVNGAPADSARAVHLPAVHRAGPVTVAVSTEGQSPALARWLRSRIAMTPGPDLALLCELLAEARAERREEHGAGEVDWPAAIDEIVPMLENGEVDRARAALARRTRR